MSRSLKFSRRSPVKLSWPAAFVKMWQMGDYMLTFSISSIITWFFSTRTSLDKLCFPRKLLTFATKDGYRVPVVFLCYFLLVYLFFSSYFFPLIIIPLLLISLCHPFCFALDFVQVFFLISTCLPCMLITFLVRTW